MILLTGIGLCDVCGECQSHRAQEVTVPDLIELYPESLHPFSARHTSSRSFALRHDPCMILFFPVLSPVCSLYGQFLRLTHKNGTCSTLKATRHFFQVRGPVSLMIFLIRWQAGPSREGNIFGSPYRYPIVVKPARSVGSFTSSPRGSRRNVRLRPRRPMKNPSSKITLSRGTSPTCPRMLVRSSG